MATESDRVTVVSGLPRSGTSLMMSMLEAGGLQPVVDGVRTADEDNPKGYYEFERVKALDKGDHDWLPDARGRVVKVISALLRHLPDNEHYDVVFMVRRLPEVLASQKKMLVRRGQPTDEATDEELTALFERHMDHVRSWAEASPHVRWLEVSYNDLMEAPGPPSEAVAEFLDRGLDLAAMQAVIDARLYRNRA